MSERQAILDGLKPLFEKARKEKLVFFAGYPDYIFTPDELEKYQANGQLIWGSVNWELAEPERMKALFKRDLVKAQKEYQSILDRLQAAGY
jgi:hypothetical protein